MNFTDFSRSIQFGSSRFSVDGNSIKMFIRFLKSPLSNAFAEYIFIEWVDCLCSESCNFAAI